MTDEQQHETVTTTTQRNLHTLLSVQELIFWDAMQMYPPVDVSGGEEQYYVRSAWHFEEMQLRRKRHTPW